MPHLFTGIFVETTIGQEKKYIFKNIVGIDAHDLCYATFAMLGKY